jgi:sigma-B regulation protein RsbU (phosphoserine phosphatase)
MVRGSELRPLESNGVPFGALADFPFQAGTTTLRPGELIAVFSDGVSEAQHGDDFFDEHRLRRVLLENASAGDLVTLREAVLSSVRDFVGDQPRTDDITLVLLKRGAAA